MAYCKHENLECLSVQKRRSSYCGCRVAALFACTNCGCPLCGDCSTAADSDQQYAVPAEICAPGKNITLFTEIREASSRRRREHSQEIKKVVHLERVKKPLQENNIKNCSNDMSKEKLDWTMSCHKDNNSSLQEMMKALQSTNEKIAQSNEALAETNKRLAGTNTALAGTIKIVQENSKKIDDFRQGLQNVEVEQMQMKQGMGDLGRRIDSNAKGVNINWQRCNDQAEVVDMHSSMYTELSQRFGVVERKLGIKKRAPKFRNGQTRLGTRRMTRLSGKKYCYRR